MINTVGITCSSRSDLIKQLTNCKFSSDFISNHVLSCINGLIKTWPLKIYISYSEDALYFNHHVEIVIKDAREHISAVSYGPYQVSGLFADDSFDMDQIL